MGQYSDFENLVYGSKCRHVAACILTHRPQKKGDDTIAANQDNADPMSASNADEMDGEMDEEMRENWKKCAMRR